LVIYVDTLIIENFIINYFLLYITSQTVRIKIKVWRLVLSALMGACYVLTKIYPSLILYTSLLFKIIVALVMIVILFGRKDILFYIKSLLIYMLYSMLLAGFCFFIEFNQQSYMGDYGSLYNFSYKKLLLSLVIIYLIIDRLIIFIGDRKDLSSLIYTVDIVNNNLETKVLAFLDTGNELREPATNLPVMIIEKRYFDNVYIDEKDIFYIPYQVINGKADKLKGFKPQYIKVHHGNEIKEREVIIALCENRLSNLSDYQALLSRGVI
jgi:stage II sporulation protein GA (sporulation sigma-E factor processing peptidase)